MELWVGIDLLVVDFLWAVHVSKIRTHRASISVVSRIDSWVTSRPDPPRPANHRVTGALRLGCAEEERFYLTLRHHQPLTHWPKAPHPSTNVPPLVWVSSLDGCSQAVVGKSRTTGSIYLTSVSSTIAKHHQRAAAPPRTPVSKRSSGESEFKRKIESNVEIFFSWMSYARKQDAKI